MTDRVTPGAFYGSAIAALCGLLLGLMLHAPWQNHSAGPRQLIASAAAAELGRPATADVKEASAEPVELGGGDETAGAARAPTVSDFN